jgi:CRISPR-associated protein Cas6
MQAAAMDEDAVSVVDVVFDLEGRQLPADFGFALMRETTRCLPWLETEPGAGIHPIRGAITDYGALLLSRRAKLVLRLPEVRVADSMALTGQDLNVGGNPLKVGAGRARHLNGYGALYAHCVAAADDEETTFMDCVMSDLEVLHIACKAVCGKRRTLRAEQRDIAGFSLMLHELTPDDSVHLQRVGIGTDRKLGCGIFVPHRLAAAVGSG